MAALSEEKIAQIQQLYDEISIYSQVAKIVGCSPSTVKKYVTAAPRIIIQTEKINFDKPIKDIHSINFEELEGTFFTLSQEEINEVERLWAEI